MMHEVRSLYGSTMDGLKMEQLNEGAINLAGIDIKSIIILVILVLSLKKLFGISAKYEQLTDKIKSLKDILMKLRNISTHRGV